MNSENNELKELSEGTQEQNEEVFDLASTEKQNKTNNILKNNTGSRKRKIVAVLLVFIILLFGVVSYFYLKAPKPEKVIEGYTTAFKTMLNAYLTQNKNEINFLEDDFKWSTDITFNTTNTTAVYNNLKLKFDGTESTKNEYAKMNLTMSQGSASQTFNAYVSGKELVLEILGVENGVLKQTLDENIFDNIKEYANNRLSKEDAKYIMEKFVEYFGESLKEANLTMEETVKEITYNITIDKDAKERINKKFNELVKADEKLSSLYKEDYTLFSSSSYSYYSNEEKDETIYGTYTINRFTKKIEKFDYKESETHISGLRTNNKEFEINYEETSAYTQYNDKYKIVITEKDKSREFKIFDKDNKEQANGTITWSDKELSVKLSDKDAKNIYNIKLSKLSDTKTNLEFSIIGDKINAVVNFDSESFDKKINNNGNIKVTYDSKDYIVNVVQTIEFGPNLVVSEPLKDGKDINSLTYEEKEKLSNDLFNRLNEFELFKSLYEDKQKEAGL